MTFASVRFLRRSPGVLPVDMALPAVMTPKADRRSHLSCTLSLDIGRCPAYHRLEKPPNAAQVIQALERGGWVCTRQSGSHVRLVNPNKPANSVTVPALPGYVGYAETEEEALSLAQEGIRFHMEALAAEGQPVPEEVDAPHIVKLHVAA